MTREDLLAKFGLQEKTVFIDSIGDNVKIKKLTISQREEVNEILFGDAKIQTGRKKMEVGIANYNKAAKLGVSFGLVEPKLTLSDIDKMSDDVSNFINEVFNAIQEFDEPKK